MITRQTDTPTVTLAEACARLGLPYAPVRVIVAAARRTPQGWVVAVAQLPLAEDSTHA